MTISDNLDLDINCHNEHIETGKKYLDEGESSFSFGAKSATLNSILQKANAPSLIDFLSLDVEGAELDVLKGIDFKKYNSFYTTDWTIKEIIWIDDNSIGLIVFDEYEDKTEYLKGGIE